MLYMYITFIKRLVAVIIKLVLLLGVASCELFRIMNVYLFVY